MVKLSYWRQNFRITSRPPSNHLQKSSKMTSEDTLFLLKTITIYTLISWTRIKCSRKFLLEIRTFLKSSEHREKYRTTHRMAEQHPVGVSCKKMHTTTSKAFLEMLFYIFRSSFISKTQHIWQFLKIFNLASNLRYFVF